MFNEHTFAVCAYGESKYLEYCIKSVLNQTEKSNVIICTSTPNIFIKNLADKYNIKLYIREGKSDIKDDWNYAYNMADTQYVTLAHQDDIYNKNYVRELHKKINKVNDDFLIYYTGYRPLKNNKVSTDINCIIRAVLRTPLNISFLQKIKYVKLTTLAFGNSICCPSVTYNKEMNKDDVFTSELKYNIDWDTFYKIAKQKGRFLYNNRILTYYRIHDEATSKMFIDNSGRIKEDTIMFDKFWPHFITLIIMKFYKKAYDTYNK